jgi:hypothetical protein
VQFTVRQNQQKPSADRHGLPALVTVEQGGIQLIERFLHDRS